jgi:hypothetical protein
MSRHSVWFTAHQGPQIIARSRTVAQRQTFLGSLIRFDRDIEAAYADFIRALVEDGWETAEMDQAGRIRTLRKVAGPRSLEGESP